MQQTAKQITDIINKSLDDLGVPAGIKDRATILSKMLQIPKQQAWGLLEGQILPDDELLQIIAAEFEIDLDSL